MPDYFAEKRKSSTSNVNTNTAPATTNVNTSANDYFAEKRKGGTNNATPSAPVTTQSANTSTQKTYADKWEKYADSSYKPSKEEKTEIKNAYNDLKKYGVQQDTYHQRDMWKEALTNGTIDPTYASNVINAYNNNSAQGTAYAFVEGLGSVFHQLGTSLGGMVESIGNAINGTDNHDWKDASKSREEAIADAKASHKVATGLGQFAGKTVGYQGVNGLLGEGTNMLGNLAIGQGADALLDTIPTITTQYLDGKYNNNDGSTNYGDMLKDIALNQGENFLYNLGGEALPYAIDALKGVDAGDALKNAMKNSGQDIKALENIDFKDTTKTAKDAAKTAKKVVDEDVVKNTDEIKNALPSDPVDLLDGIDEETLKNFGDDDIVVVKKPPRPDVDAEIPQLKNIDDVVDATKNSTTEYLEQQVKALDDAIKQSDDTLNPLIKNELESERNMFAEELDKLKGAEKVADDVADTVVKETANSRYASRLERTDMPDEVTAAFKENPAVYEVLKNADTKAKADNIFKNNELDESLKIYNDLIAKKDPTAVPLGYEIASKLIDEGKYDGAMYVLEDMSRSLTQSGQFSQAAWITMLHGDPMAALRLMEKNIQKINSTGLDKFGKKWKNFALTADEIKAFKKIKPGDKKAIQTLFEDITERMAKDYPSTTWEKLVELSKTSMMLNPRTHIRNVSANSVMLPVRSFSDRVSALGQNIAHIINPDIQVTQSLVGGTRAQKKIANQIFDEQIKPLLEGSGKWEDVAKNVPRGKQVFKDSAIGRLGKKATMFIPNSINTLTNGKIQNFVDKLDASMTDSVLENLRKFDYWLLGAVEDDPFVKTNFSNRLASYMKAQGIDDIANVPNDAIQLAYQEALKATFKDDNYLTKMFANTKKDWGKFGEVALPFTKTPANLAKRGIEYSPVGFIDTIKNAKGKNASMIIDDISKNLVGTAGIVGGFLLAKNGLIQGALSGNKDEAAFEKQQGKVAFSVKVDGHYYSFDWAQPASIPMIIGATIYDAVQESDKEETNYLNLAKQSGIAAFDAWAGLSPLSSLQSLFGGGEYGSDSMGENVYNAITDFPQRFWPAIAGATARTIDPVMRETYVNGDLVETYLNNTQAKIPELSEELPAKYDTWGREKLRQDTTGSAFIANFLNPGTLGYDASTPIDSEIEALGKYPHVAGWSVEVGDDNIKLTNQQHSDYQRIMGQYSYDLAEKFINSSNYQNMSDDDKRDTLTDLYGLAKSMAENELFGKEIASKYLKAYKAYKSNGADGVLNFYATKNTLESYGLASNNEKALSAYNRYGDYGLRTYANIKALGTTKKDTLTAYLDKLPMTNEERQYWFSLFNSGSNPYDYMEIPTLY